ncbi:hypothetical protein [Geodermatophilus sp. CPCC 205761]|uniref:hypothetical protein n=1 Tax=Geodermatophilus sp. CPCC 205761 TaxID=2936597 RepID=UPI003EEAE0C2
MAETGTTPGDLAERSRDRLTVLRHELQLGETRLRELEREQTQLQQTLLRISGAVQVLQELLDPAGEDAAPAG